MKFHGVAKRNTISRFSLPAVVILTLVGLLSTHQAHAIDPQLVCSDTEDPSKSFCRDVEISQWRWTSSLDLAGYGPFSSESDAINRVIPIFVNGQPSGYCSMTPTGVTHDTSPPTYTAGIDSTHVHRVDYVTVVHNSSNCQTTLSSWAQLTQLRDVSCPAPLNNGEWGWTLVYEAGNPNTPYCAMPWTKVHKVLGGMCKGNPCDPLTGVKKQLETDYVGAGSSPLRFSRQYLSSAAYEEATHTPALHSVLGHGWTANYFQSIAFSATGPRQVAVARRPNGEVRTFRKSGASFIAELDANERLVRFIDGGGNTTGWQLTTQDDEVELYDAQGRLSSITNRKGVVQTLNYGGGQYPLTVTDPFGNQITFGYTTASFQKLASLTLPGGTQVSYGYDANNNLTSVTYPDTKTRIYHYEDTPNLLTGITDEAGVRFATWGYDFVKRVTSSEHAGGVDRYTIVYNGTNRVVTDPLGQQRTYGFVVKQGVRRVASSTALCPGCNEAKSQTYDANGNVAVRTNFNNVETRYSYDLSRNLETSRTEAYGTPRARTITTQWHSTFRLPTQIDEPGKRTTFTHDSNGSVLTQTVLDTTTSESRTWTYTYNSFGQVLTANGPRTDVSDVTTYTYYSCTTGYECGQVNTITNALGHVTTYSTYNAHGQPLTITDPNGLVTTLTYDLRQRLSSRTVGGEQITFTYWPTGMLKKATLPDGSFLEYTYDGAHRLTEIEDSEGNRIVYTLDNMGNRTAEQLYDPSNALTQTRTRVFNTLNQLWKEIGAAGTSAVTTSFGYDNNGNQTGINAPLSRNTSQAYDELNRLTQVTDPLSGATQYGYNALDQLISVTDPRSKVTGYTYSALGDLTQQVSPDTGTTTNTYDSSGNLATSIDARSKTATYAYDALNRVTSLTYPDQTLSYTYDSGTNQRGRLTQVTDASGSTSWTYDTHGRVLSRQQGMGITKTIGYAYDSEGRLQTLTLPSGNTITYAYSDGKITSLTLNGSTTIISNVLYQPFGPTRGWTWGNSTLAIREYDTDGKITDIDSAGLKSYSYDDAFRITGITDAANSSLSQSYGYDLLDRLTSATGTSLSQGWTYDANGNRLSQTGSAGSAYTVSGTSNRLSSVTGALTRSYSYDNAGNTTADGAATFGYNDAGRMISATKASVTTSYALNALGQRVKKTTSGSSTYFVYDEAGHLIGEYNNAGTLIQETVWFGDIPVATLRPNGGGVDVFYVHTDHLNTPRRISRPSDNVVVWRWDSDPFGTTAVNEDPDGDLSLFAYNLRFPGQYFDAESGLHYNYFRHYEPQTGRYLSADPLGLAGGNSLFLYAAANPIVYVDPLGLICGDWMIIDRATYHTLRQRAAYLGDTWWWEVVLRGDISFDNGLEPTSIRTGSPPMKPGGSVPTIWYWVKVEKWLVQDYLEYWDVVNRSRPCAETYEECGQTKVRSWTERDRQIYDRPDLTHDIGPPRTQYSSRRVGPGTQHNLP